MYSSIDLQEKDRLSSGLLHLTKRPRRNRRTQAIRCLTEETRLTKSDLVAAFFTIDGVKEKHAIPSLPHHDRLSVDLLVKEVERLHVQGIPGIILFPVIPQEEKDDMGSYALKEEGVIPRAIQAIKKEMPSLCIIVDLALDPFTSHGHDGLVSKQGEILNDETVHFLAEIALLYAQAGADIIAPSDMMDGRVAAIRKKLDHHYLKNVGILSCTAKYASSLYTPFRDTLASHVKFGDKKSYHMNPANVREALLEAKLDEEEGADMLMVKPALYYLDVIAKMRAESHLPIGAFHVSGEYAMVMAAHEKNYLNAKNTFYEALLSIKRAGADFILTYAASEVLDLLD